MHKTLCDVSEITILWIPISSTVVQIAVESKYKCKMKY